jgi:hypothetical protein
LTVIKPTLLNNLIDLELAKYSFYNTQITSIPSGLFYYNTKLKDVQYIFNNNQVLTDVPEDLFINNPLLESVYSMFGACKALETVPEDLFKFQPNLRDIAYLFSHSGLKEIPQKLFSYSENIAGYYYTFYNTPIISVPDGVILNLMTSGYLSNSAGFYNCPNLKTIVIPESLWSIGGSFFYGCPAIEWIELKSITPPECTSDTFVNSIETVYPIYVPDAAIEDYKAASGFIGYASRIFPVSQKPIQVDE